jgi:flagellar biosynthetic protein FlhB
VQGFTRIFSKATAVKAGLDILKLIAIGLALYVGAKGLLEDPLFTAPVEAGYLAQFLNQASIAFFSRLLLSLGVIAALSYGWEKFKTSRDMMMTRQEIKDEHKQSEGDAKVKGAMRRMARRLLQKQMLEAVATADVVVTNPTHFAVALKYERGIDKAPVVLAKGENRFAQRIKALAAENGVPMVENKPVARLLFALGKVGEGIPPELYQAVAEILAVVYRTHRFYFHQLKTRRLENSAVNANAGSAHAPAAAVA